MLSDSNLINKSSLTLGNIITEDTIIEAIMREEESRHKFMNIWAKFLLNDFMGMLKKKKKTIEEAPHTHTFRKYLLAFYYGSITRNQLREYVDALI